MPLISRPVLLLSYAPIWNFLRLLSYSRAPAAASCTAHILDGDIDKILRQIFERMKSVPKSEIVNARCRQKTEERKQLLRSVRAEHAKAAAEPDLLNAEIIRVLRGESTFSKELLSGMVSETEASTIREQLAANPAIRAA